jgi:predicted porin
MIQSSISQRALKRTLVSAALLALSAGAAQAQSVTLYGRVDAGFQYQSKTGANGDSLSEIHNGGILPSIWGFRGSEDLGGGLKAVFNLEGDFDSGTGASRGLGGGAGGLFPRQANVGLGGDWGKVLIGRQYSVALLADLAVDPRGFKESLSSLSSYALTQVPAGNENTGNNTLGIFTGNAVSYSNNFGPLAVGVAYGFGEVAGKSSQGTTTSLGLTYAGPITVSGSYQQIKGIGSSDDKTQRVSVGVAVPFDAFTFKAYYANAKEDFAGSEFSKTDNYGIGVDFAWNAQNTLTAAYYNGKEKNQAARDTVTLGAGDGKTSSFILSNDYALSKRTTIYAQYAYVDRGNGATGGTTIDFGGTTPGETNSIIGFGIKHDF